MLTIHHLYKTYGIQPILEDISLTISGSCAEWEDWTKMKFPQSGKYVIPGALNPIEINIERDQGVYIEPNVWMVHEIG